MLITKTLGDALQWVRVTAPTDADFTTLTEQYHVPHRFIAHLRSTKTQARFDYDIDQKFGMCIFKVLAVDDKMDSEQVKTTPFAFLLLGQTLVTVTQAADDTTESAIATEYKHHGAAAPSPTLLMLAVMTAQNSRYFDRINALDDLRAELERYKTTPTNAQIVSLAEVSKSMVYLKAAASANLITARQLQAGVDSDEYADKLPRHERYWLRNLINEFEQAKELAQVNGEIVQQVTDTYANLLDKNLNTTMWIMTIWSLALAIPPIISGFYGMNVKLPILGGWLDWPFSILLSVIPAGLLIWRLGHRKNLSVKDL